MKIRPLLVRVHLWVALSTGLLLLIIGVTGAMLVFAPAYERARHPELLVVEPGQERRSLDELVDKVRPFGDPAIMVVPKRNDESMHIFVINEQKKPVSVYINPYTGDVLGAVPVAEAQKGLMLRVRAIHRTLLLGKRGQQIVGAVTVLSVLMAISGLVLWWPRKIVRVKRGVSLSRFNFDLHNVVGLFNSSLLLILSLTGIVIAYPQLGQLIRNLDDPGRTEPEYSAPAGTATALSLDSLVRIGQGTIAGGAPAAVTIPRPGSAVINMGIRQPGEAANATRSRVWLDRFTGAVLRVDDVRNPAPGNDGTRLGLSIAMLHTGVLFGWITLTLVLLGAIGQVVLVITGVLIWTKRTFRTPRARAA